MKECPDCANWERKEVERASCCAANEDAVKTLTAQLAQAREALTKLEQIEEERAEPLTQAFRTIQAALREPEVQP